MRDYKGSFDSSVNQRIKGKFIEREVYANVNTMVEYIIKKGYEDPDAPFSMDDITNLSINHDEEIEELEEKIEALEEQIEDLDEKQEEEQEENQDLLDAEEISEFTFDRNTAQIEEKYENMRIKLQKEIDEFQEEIDELEETNGDIQEVYEWWMVSSWFMDKLRDKGEAVIENENIWGRCTTGQAILLDGIISEICYEMGILEGMENS